MAQLRNIDRVGTYTSSSFIIDNLVQRELSIFVECKDQCGGLHPTAVWMIEVFFYTQHS